MKYRIFKRCGKNFRELFTKEAETQEIVIKADGVVIDITEHQFGIPMKNSYIEITTNKGSWCMDLKTFIQKIST